MADRKQYAAGALVGLGLIIGFAAPLVFNSSLDENIRLGLATVGGLTTFGGGFWFGNQHYNRENLDERFIKIHHRAGWNGFWAVLTVLGTAIFVFETTSVTVSLAEVDLYLMFVGLFAYILSVSWYKRTT